MSRGLALALVRYLTNRVIARVPVYALYATPGTGECWACGSAKARPC